VDTESKVLSVRKQCSLLKVSRAGLYYEPKVSIEDAVLMNEIHEIWLTHPYYGYRRIREILLRRGFEINRKRVARLMREMNLGALYPKPKTSLRGKEETLYPYLLTGIKIERPNQAWGVDLTYIPMHRGFVYLVALIDIFSRYVVGWNLAVTLETESCLIALEKALMLAIPEIINSDQGCQFTSGAWSKALIKQGIKISMDGKGRCLDNVFIERFWRSLKYEDMYLKAYNTVADARENIGSYILFYNEQRPHQSLDYRTPAEVYFSGKKDSEKLLNTSVPYNYFSDKGATLGCILTHRQG
jgi:putative transposase